MIPGIQTSLAALFTFGNKLSSSARNIANINTDGYKKRITRISENEEGLPEATTTVSDAPGLFVPDGDQVRETSNVDLAEELPQMMIAKRGYEANLKGIKVQDQLFKSTLDILA
jgi:flagellar basal body rod protein FlgG